MKTSQLIGLAIELRRYALTIFSVTIKPDDGLATWQERRVKDPDALNASVRFLAGKNEQILLCWSNGVLSRKVDPSAEKTLLLTMHHKRVHKNYRWGLLQFRQACGVIEVIQVQSQRDAWSVFYGVQLNRKAAETFLVLDICGPS